MFAFGSSLDGYPRASLLYLGGRGSQKWRLTGELISHPTVELVKGSLQRENYHGKIETDLGLISCRVKINQTAQ